MDEPRGGLPYPAATAAAKLQKLRARPFFATLLRLFTQRPDETLLSFDQVQELLRSRQEIDRGTQVIRIAHIVGSVGRYRDFDRAFLPLEGADDERWMRLDIAINELRSLPPIEVYEIGGVYFVRDGNHRVSVAVANGLEEIEAHVTEVDSVVPLEPGVDVDGLIIKAEYAHFLRQTGLDESRPDQAVILTEPGRYRILLEHIDVHRFYLGLQWGREPSLAEAAASWYDAVYLSVVEAIHDTRILSEFPGRTEADLYLWVAYHRERLKKRYGVMPDDRTVAASIADQFSGKPVARFTKRITRAVNAAMAAAAESPEPPVSEPEPVAILEAN
jgi:hypothetical protein